MISESFAFSPIGLQKQLPKWRPKQRLGGRIPNATEWPLDNLFQRHNNKSWTAYISVNFYTIYMLFTYNSIIMLT